MPLVNSRQSPSVLDAPPSGTTRAAVAPQLPSASPAATTLWLIRHAEVEERYQSVFGGRIDMGLSQRGHEQSRTLAKYLHGKPMQALYASPMKRVQETLAPLLLN